MLLVCLSAFLICIALVILFHLHMFQLHSYVEKAQLKWMKANGEKLLSLVGVVVFASAAFFMPPTWALASMSVAFVVVAYFNRPRKAKKSLVFTQRVQRLLVTISLIYLILIALILYRFTSNSAMLCRSLSLCCLAAPFIVLLANILNRPVEAAIRNYYIRDAKQMLHSATNLVVIGVTGSFGKTSVKYFLNTLLQAQYNVLMTPESYNTPMGVVKTIRGQLKATHELFICEMGARNVGDIKELCDIVHPTHGVITSVGPQHMETFKSLDNIKKTKFELADSLPSNGHLFLNGDSPAVVEHNSRSTAITYGLGEDNQYVGYGLKVSGKGTTFSVKVPNGESFDYSTKLIGTHNVVNVVGAIAVCHSLGISLNALKLPIRKLESVPHRLQLIERGDLIVIDDSYNSNPSGAKAALETLSLFAGTKIIVTPGLVELGDMMEECNAELGKEIARVCDRAVLIGEKQTRPIYQGLVDAGYPAERIFVASSLEEGMGYVYSLEGCNEKVVLLENDLPDNY